MNKAAAIAAVIPRLRRYARALTGNAAQADDLVQDCLVRGLANQAQWREGASPRKWLFTILHNLYIDETRARSRRLRQVDLETIEAERQPSAAGADIYSAVEIGQALAQLPGEQRQTLLLVALEGLSYAEAADVLDVPIGTVMSRISRAREELRRLIYGAPAGKTRLKRVK